MATQQDEVKILSIEEKILKIIAEEIFTKENYNKLNEYFPQIDSATIWDAFMKLSTTDAWFYCSAKYFPGANKDWMLSYIGSLEAAHVDKRCVTYNIALRHKLRPLEYKFTNTTVISLINNATCDLSNLVTKCKCPISCEAAAKRDALYILYFEPEMQKKMLKYAETSPIQYFCGMQELPINSPPIPELFDILIKRCREVCFLVQNPPNLNFALPVDYIRPSYFDDRKPTSWQIINMIDFDNLSPALCRIISAKNLIDMLTTAQREKYYQCVLTTYNINSPLSVQLSSFLHNPCQFTGDTDNQKWLDRINWSDAKNAARTVFDAICGRDDIIYDKIKKLFAICPRRMLIDFKIAMDRLYSKTHDKKIAKIFSDLFNKPTYNFAVDVTYFATDTRYQYDARSCLAAIQADPANIRYVKCENPKVYEYFIKNYQNIDQMVYIPATFALDTMETDIKYIKYPAFRQYSKELIAQNPNIITAFAATYDEWKFAISHCQQCLLPILRQTNYELYKNIVRDIDFTTPMPYLHVHLKKISQEMMDELIEMNDTIMMVSTLNVKKYLKKARHLFKYRDYNFKYMEFRYDTKFTVEWFEKNVETCVEWTRECK